MRSDWSVTQICFLDLAGLHFASGSAATLSPHTTTVHTLSPPCLDALEVCDSVHILDSYTAPQSVAALLGRPQLGMSNKPTRER